MKRFLDVVKGVCSIAAAIVIYITVTKAADGADVLPYVVASVLAVCLAASVFCISSLAGRVEILEREMKAIVDSPYGEEYDGGDEAMPELETPAAPEESGEYFATEDPDYTGTDFSEEYPVSANADDEEKI